MTFFSANCCLIFILNIHKKCIWYQFKIFSQKYAHNKKEEKKLTARSSNCSVSVKFFPMLVKMLYFGGIINQKTFLNQFFFSCVVWTYWFLKKIHIKLKRTYFFLLQLLVWDSTLPWHYLEDIISYIRKGKYCPATATPATATTATAVSRSGYPPYIRKGKYCPATTTPATATTAPAVSCLGYPPWILKRGGLESSGQRLISSIGKTKRIPLQNISSSFFFYKMKYLLQWDPDWWSSILLHHLS